MEKTLNSNDIVCTHYATSDGGSWTPVLPEHNKFWVRCIADKPRSQISPLEYGSLVKALKFSDGSVWNCIKKEWRYPEINNSSDSVMESETGDKADLGKPRMDLISPITMAYLAQVLTFGAKKYSAHNWRKGIPLSKLIAASQRHLTAIAAGIDTDEETGLPHAAHLLCEAMFICEQLVSPLHASTDDRYQYEESQKNLLVALLAGTVEK